MPRPLEPYEGMIRPYAPELSVHSGPAGLKIPVCTFDAQVRMIDMDDPLVGGVFHAAFPAFAGGEKHYPHRDVMGGRYRRYAGSSGTLDSRSYFSVARWNGRDDGSLVREIFAYSDPSQTGMVMIDDMSDARDAASINGKYGSSFEPGDYLLLFAHEPERLMTKELEELAASRGGVANFYKIPLATVNLRRENVVDLRLPAVQAWFFETFSKEKWLNIHFPLPPVRSFLELLVVMLGQNRGGNAMTQSVGRELRLWGIGGLVYPSARCDAAVMVEDSQVIDWYGWNLVDYEKTRETSRGEFNPLTAFNLSTMADPGDMTHPTALFGLPVGQLKINHTDQGARQGTWQVRGLETANSRQWVYSLDASQRQLLGLAEDASLVEFPDDGLDEAERRLRRGYRALVRENRGLAIDEAELRHLLGALARELTKLPGGGRVAISVADMADRLDLGPSSDAFVEIAVGTGILVEDPTGYVRFDRPDTLAFFTAVP